MKLQIAFVVVVAWVIPSFFIVVIIPPTLSYWNAKDLGRTWADAEAGNEIMKTVTWERVILSIFGFFWCVKILLAFACLSFPECVTLEIISSSTVEVMAMVLSIGITAEIISICAKTKSAIVDSEIVSPEPYQGKYA